jgi:hypothetical protein
MPLRFMIIFKINVYLLIIYLYNLMFDSQFKHYLWSNQFKYIESQYLSCLACDLFCEIMCSLLVEMFGDPCSKTSRN